MSGTKICILDYSIGNNKSIQNAIKILGYDSIVSNVKSEIESADKLILPGVGSFKEALEFINKHNLDQYIKNFFYKKKPILGICLGMQILFESGEEGGANTKGLGILKGKIIKIPNKNNFIYPNIGWRKINFKKNIKNSFLAGITDKDLFYFVHSYFANTDNNKTDIIYSNIDEFEFPSIIIFKNLYATQFHPEKSSKSGLKLLKNFLNL